MKKSLLLICISLCIASCQSEMDSVNPINTWSQIKSYPAQKANDVVFLQDTLIIADNASTPIFYTGNNNVASWTATSSSVGSVAPLISYAGGLYCGAMGSVYYSNNFCRTWVQKNSGLPNNLVISDLVATDIGLYVCGNGLYYSKDKGDTWNGISIPGITNVLSIVYIDHTLIASTNAGIYNSVDNGKSWVLLNSSSGISSASISKLAVFENAIYAGSSIVANSEVYASYDKGNSWVKSHGLDVLGPNSFYAFQFYHGTLYVASTHGVFESVNNGRDWVYSGCDNAVSLIANGSVLYCGTASNGLWSTVMQEVY